MRALAGRLAPAAAITVIAAAALAGPSFAEVAQEDGVRVSVSGSISPTKLPRSGSAPVSLSLSSHITPTKKSALPKLTSIEIALNSHGKIQTKVIPVCRLGHISPSTTQQALLACAPSLVGEGHFSADVRIPEQSPFPSKGKVLAFNGKLNGRPALFAHVYGTEPVPTSYVLAFQIEKAKGTFGTILRASLPQATGEWGYVTGVSIDLDRGYASAGCPAPKGFPAAVFPLMKTRFAFKGGPNLTSTLNRSCKAR